MSGRQQRNSRWFAFLLGAQWVPRIVKLFKHPGIIEAMSGTLQRILHDFAFAFGAHFRM